MKVNLDLTSTLKDFPKLVGWYFKCDGGWFGPYKTLDVAKSESKSVIWPNANTFVYLDVTKGFWSEEE